MNNVRLWLNVIIGLLLLGGVAYMITTRTSEDDSQNGSTVQVSDFDSCVAAGNPVMESYPRQCAVNGVTYTEELTGPVLFNSDKGELIELNDFQSGEKIASPLTITGRVPGSWSFEAVFPVVLVDWDGRIIAQAQAQLTDDWMTDELVPFEVTIEFETPTYNNAGALILQKDNPSDLPENDDALEVSIVFQ